MLRLRANVDAAKKKLDEKETETQSTVALLNARLTDAEAEIETCAAIPFLPAPLVLFLSFFLGL